jgi:FkbM family methyltransferase
MIAEGRRLRPMTGLREMLRRYYSILRPIYVPLLRSGAFQKLGLLPFDAFLMRARPEARLFRFSPRYPFAQDRGPAAKSLLTTDPNSRFGHEPELAHLIDRLVPDDGVFLDVGSNAGYFSIYLATRQGFHGHVHAFEPIPGSFGGLRELVVSLGCDTIVTCHRAAVSDRVGVAMMEVAADPALSSINDGTAADGESVRTLTLDSLKFDRADFIKIDVEGHEAKALRGAAALIETHQPFVFLESWTFPAAPDKVFEALRFLIDRGYRWYLPAWLQPDGTFFIGVGPDHDMARFALLPFSPEDRLVFPGNPINLFACPISQASSLGEPWPAKS